MSTILIGGVLLSFSGALALLSRRRIEEWFGLSVLLVVVVLYGFGIFGLLTAGIYAVLALALLAAGLCLWRLAGRGESPKWTLLLTPGCAVFALLLGLALFYYRGRLCDSHDEFSHWILEIKNMWLLSALPNGDWNSTVHFRNYPPATALFSYFWMKLSGGFNEADAFRANMVFTLSMLLPLFRKVSWKDWAAIPLLAAGCFLLPLALNGSCYNSIYVDTLLGCACAYPLILYLTPAKKNSGFGRWVSACWRCR